MLVDELLFVEENNPILKAYINKYVLVYNRHFIDVCDDFETAVKTGIQKFGIQADFLVHQITNEEPANFVACTVLGK